MRVAFVVQRYGEFVVGGAEQGCRQLAHLMSNDWEVSVITTCAENYLTWENRFEPGESRDGNVTVHRFPVENPRDFAKFSATSASVERRAYKLSADLEVQRFIDQGPHTTALVEYIRSHQENYDIFIFYTYLYYSTVAALPFVAHKSYLVTTAHDEPPLYFVRTYAPIFHSLKGIIYLSEAEKNLVNHIYRVPSQVRQTVVGLGIPSAREINRNQMVDLDRKYKDLLGNDPYILYVGRVAPAKGCNELLSRFIEFKQRRQIGLSLVIVGATEIEIPNHEYIKYLGYVTEVEKSYLLRKCKALINPSHLESFSIVIMEAWEHGRPVIVNGASNVMRDYCDQANAGIYYFSELMFQSILEWTAANDDQLARLGVQGQQFVRRHFSWDNVREKLLAEVT